MLRQAASLNNDVEQEPHIVARRKLLTNEEDWEKCGDLAKGAILSWSAGGVEKKAIDVNEAPPYRRMIVPIMNGHAAAISSYAY